MSNSPIHHVVFLVLDSLRADVAEGIPFIENNAVTFTQARAAGCWTLPAHASMFTGRYPHEHRCDRRSRKLSTAFPTLAEIFREDGWRTHMVTANGVTTNKPNWGLDRGFETVYKTYEHMGQTGLTDLILLTLGVPRLRKAVSQGDVIMDESELAASKVWVQDTTKNVFEEVSRLRNERRQAGECSFIYANAMPFHFPYHVTDRTTPWNLLFGEGTISTTPMDKLREIVALYQFVSEDWLRTDHMTIRPEMLACLRERQRIAWRRLAKLVNSFAEELYAEDTLVVICADHGDAHGEQNEAYHIQTVSDACSRVPLWILHPGLLPKCIHKPISMVDIFPLILGLSDRHSKGSGPFADLEGLTRSPVIMQTHYKHNATLVRRVGQFAFVDNGRRYRFEGPKENGLWYTAPIGASGAPEPIWEPAFGTNLIEEAIHDRGHRGIIGGHFAQFRNFSTI